MFNRSTRVLDERSKLSRTANWKRLQCERFALIRDILDVSHFTGMALIE